MKNTLQNNPSNAADDNNLWPDWNSKHGEGTPVEGNEATVDLQENYEKQREGALKRQEGKNEAS